MRFNARLNSRCCNGEVFLHYLGRRLDCCSLILKISRWKCRQNVSFSWGVDWMMVEIGKQRHYENLGEIDMKLQTRAAEGVQPCPACIIFSITPRKFNITNRWYPELPFVKRYIFHQWTSMDPCHSTRPLHLWRCNGTKAAVSPSSWGSWWRSPRRSGI